MPYNPTAIWRARRNGARVSWNQVVITAGSTVAPNSEVARRVLLYSSNIGPFSLVADDAKIYCTDIGSFCSISWNASIGALPHHVDRATTHDFPDWAAYGIYDGPSLIGERPRVSVGADVWVGCYAIIRAGVRISDGAVIGAGAIVTRDVEPYQIVAGAPARTLRSRFSDDVVQRLLRIRWWEWPIDVIRQNVELFRQPLTADTLCRLEDVTVSIQ